MTTHDLGSNPIGATQIFQAPVVQMTDSAIHRKNHYPLDNSIGFATVTVYPLDSDLSCGYCYPSFEKLGPGVFKRQYYCLNCPAKYKDHF